MAHNVGERIKQLRISKKISAEDLGKQIGKSRATIYRYENGEIEEMPYTVLIPIAKALGTTPTFLLGVDEDATNVTPTPTTPTRLFKELSVFDFTDDEIDELINFAKYLLSKRQ